MKTDGEHFAQRMLQDLLDEGLTHMKARIARDEIVRTAEAKGWPEVNFRARAKVCRFSADMQSVFVDDDGIAILHTGIRREFQPIVQVPRFGQTRKAA